MQKYRIILNGKRFWDFFKNILLDSLREWCIYNSYIAAAGSVTRGQVAHAAAEKTNNDFHSRRESHHFSG